MLMRKFIVLMFLIFASPFYSYAVNLCSNKDICLHSNGTFTFSFYDFFEDVSIVMVMYVAQVLMTAADIAEARIA